MKQEHGPFIIRYHPLKRYAVWEGVQIDWTFDRNQATRFATEAAAKPVLDRIHQRQSRYDRARTEILPFQRPHPAPKSRPRASDENND